MEDATGAEDSLLGQNLVISIQKPQTQSIATGKVPKESGIKHLDLSSWK
jgi:hypothetical protein